MRIQHNVMAMNAYRNYTNNVSAMKKNLEKLSSGYKINRAGDDAAGLAISEKMRAQITGLETAQKNAKDGISLVQTAEGALTEVHDMLNRMVELATQSANGTYDNDTDRFQLQKEMDQLRTEINRIADSANFNGIKLFDGSLSGADITATGIETSQIDMAKGVEVVQGSNGGGSNGTFTINLDSALGDGDTLAIKFGGQVATDLGGDTLTLTYAGTTAATATTGNIEVGKDLNEQATNIMKALKANTAVSKNFDITTDGNSVILTAKIEGNNTTNTTTGDMTSTVTGITSSNKDAVSAFDKTTTAAADDTAGVAVFGGMFENGAGGGFNVSKGDILTFEVKVGNQTMTLTAEAGKDFDVKDTQLNTAKELVAFLNDKATFDDDDSTFIDESTIKFGDLFTAADVVDATGKTTGLKLSVKSGLVSLGAATVADAEIKITNTKPDGTTIKATGTATGGVASGTAAKAQEYTLALNTTGNAQNLAIGDKLTLEGKLLDGRTFKFDVVAGKDFQVGKTYADTLKNLKTTLESDSFSITLKDANNVESTAKGSDIFGDNAEIKIDLTAGAEKFVSNAKGTMASQLTNMTLTAGPAADASANLKNGDQKTSADSTITLSDGLSYGAVVEVDGKKYELVKAAGDVSNANNKAVIVDDISDLASAAKALAEAIKGDVDSADYKVTASNNKVTIASTKVGSTAQAISASASGDKTTQIEFTLDPQKMQAGSTVTINGQTYEFVDKGGKPTDKANQTIEVADFSKETAASLGSALAKAANGQKNASVTVDGDGKVTVRGLVDGETNEIVTPSVKFDGGKSGLRLQIGDTAEDFNQMTVSIYNMHCADMGIGNISIADQDSAAVAIDAIKSAINYVSDVRGTLGATQNRLDHTINNLSVMTENIQDAESTIRDTDVAAEMMAYTKNNILIQSAQAMLAQANQVPQGVLQLLQ